MEQRDPQTYAIIGAAMEVHKTLGCGFLEAVYQDAMAIEMKLRNIPFEREYGIPIDYKDVRLNTHYRCDFLCYNEIPVEMKAIQKLSGTDESQIINALKGTKMKRGLLINFGTLSLEYRRFVNSPPIT